METALIKVFAFVCIIVAGYCMGHTGKLGTMPGEFVSKIVFTFTLPCAVLHAFGAADFSPQMLLLVPLGFVFAFGAYLVTFAITPRTKREDRTFYLLNGCGFNLGCFALPFVQAIFSPTMAVATCLYDAGNAFMMAGGSYALTGLIAGGSRIQHPVRFVAKRLFSSLPFDTYLLIIVLSVAGGSPALRAGGLHRAHRERQLVSGNVHARAHDELLHLARAHGEGGAPGRAARGVQRAADLHRLAGASDR